MSDSYLVKCPQFGCGWTGVLPGQNCDADSWHDLEPTLAIIAFECPSCKLEWRARIIGARAKPLCDDGDDMGAKEWPPLEIGVGD
jgi:hypothetical protein